MQQIHRRSVARKACRAPLLDGDLPRARSSLLRHNNREDTVLQACLDIVMVDMAREGKSAVEFPDGALADPVVVLVLGLGHGLVSRLGDIVVIVLGSVGSVEFTLGSAFNHQGLGVGELDVDALLRNAGQLAIEVVAFFVFADVKARRERAQRRGLVVAGAVDIVVVQQTEEGTEVSGSGHGSEERHFGKVVVQRLFKVS